MNLSIPGQGLRYFLDAILDAIDNSALVRLFQNDHFPAVDDDLADYTEANFEGYVQHGAVNWSAPVTVGQTTYTQADEVQFLKGFGGVSNSVYGYFLTDGTGTVLLAAQRYPGPPVSMGADGAIIRVVPRLSLYSAEPVVIL